MGAGAVIFLHLGPWAVTSWVPLTSAEDLWLPVPCGEAPSPRSHAQWGRVSAGLRSTPSPC